MNDPDLLDALTMNRQGRLAPSQAAVLGRAARRSRIRRAVEALAAGVMAVLIVVLTRELAAFGLGEAFPLLAAGALALLLVAIIAFDLRPWTDPLGADVREGRVESASGSPERTGREPASDALRSALVGVLRSILNLSWSSGADPRVIIGGRALWLSKELAESLPDGILRAYYLPRSMTLVAIEPVPPGVVPDTGQTRSPELAD